MLPIRVEGRRNLVLQIESLLPLGFVLCFALLIRQRRHFGTGTEAQELALLLAPAVFALSIVLVHWGVLARLDPAVRRRVVQDNAVELYKLPIPP
jgi:hypothetical protein